MGDSGLGNRNAELVFWMVNRQEKEMKVGKG